MKPVRFTQHALDKIDLLARYGFTVSQEVVIETLQSPDRIETNTYPPVAQRRVGENTVLRVVYIEDSEGYLVITFYPGERKRYED